MARRYSMHRRNANVEETRQRIVDATMQLHNEKGILATSMQDVAARADVALGTVYRHFPTVDDLVPACGARVFELEPQPAPEAFAQINDNAERVQALVVALFAHYEAAERPYEVGYYEAAHLPVLNGLMQQGAANLRRLVETTLSPLGLEEDGLRLALAMTSFRSWQAFKDAGFTTDKAARTAAHLLLSEIEPSPFQKEAP